MKYALSILSVDYNLTQADINTILSDLLSGFPTGSVESITQKWLSQDEAHHSLICPFASAKISLSTLSAHIHKLRQQYQPNRFDINLIPYQTDLRKHLLIADMDSTIVTSETLDDLANFVGLGAKVSNITAQAMRGEIDFKQAVRARVQMLENMPESKIQQAIQNLNFTKGAHTLVRTMRQKHAYTALVSGGFRHFTKFVAEKIGFHEHHANQLQIKNKVLTGKVIDPIQDKNSKEHILNTLSQSHNIDLNACITVGDGANDIPMLNRTNQGGGIGVGYHAKPTVHQQILPQIIYHDLSGLLFLQGYARNQFQS